jgi:hypothetical protein
MGNKTSSKNMEHTDAQERRHVLDKKTWGNSSMVQSVRSQGKKVLQGLHLRNALKVQLIET